MTQLVLCALRLALSLPSLAGCVCCPCCVLLSKRSSKQANAVAVRRNVSPVEVMLRVQATNTSV